MGKKWRQLKYEDRLKIYAWLQDKTSVATIAKRLGVCRQTIYREIKRGEFVKRNTDYTESTVYDPYVAEEHYQKKLKERGRNLKIGSDLKLLHYIEKKIVDEKRSPYFLSIMFNVFTTVCAFLSGIRYTISFLVFLSVKTSMTFLDLP